MSSLAMLGARGVEKVTLLRKFDEDKNPLGMQLCYGNEIRVFVDGKVSIVPNGTKVFILNLQLEQS